jgi:hypothetical protein
MSMRDMIGPFATAVEGARGRDGTAIAGRDHEAFTQAAASAVAQRSDGRSVPRSLRSALRATRAAAQSDSAFRP